jgi:hypothetical protein
VSNLARHYKKEEKKMKNVIIMVVALGMSLFACDEASTESDSGIDSESSDLESDFESDSASEEVPDAGLDSDTDTTEEDDAGEELDAAASVSTCSQKYFCGGANGVLIYKCKDGVKTVLKDCSTIGQYCGVVGTLYVCLPACSPDLHPSVECVVR